MTRNARCASYTTTLILFSLICSEPRVNNFYVVCCVHDSVNVYVACDCDVTVVQDYSFTWPILYKFSYTLDYIQHILYAEEHFINASLCCVCERYVSLIIFNLLFCYLLRKR